MSSASPAPGAAVDHLAALRRFPASLVLLLGLCLTGGLYVASRHLGAEAVAMCNGEPMAPGDRCEQRIPRPQGRGATTRIRSYEEALVDAARAHEYWVWLGVGVAVLAAIVIVLVVVRLRSDVALARTLTGQRAPAPAYSATTGMRVGIGFGAAAIVAMLGLAAGVYLGATDGEIVGVVVAALSVISALGIVVAERRGAPPSSGSATRVPVSSPAPPCGTCRGATCSMSSGCTGTATR